MLQPCLADSARVGTDLLIVSEIQGDQTATFSQGIKEIWHKSSDQYVHIIIWTFLQNFLQYGGVKTLDISNLFRLFDLKEFIVWYTTGCKDIWIWKYLFVTKIQIFHDSFLQISFLKHVLTQVLILKSEIRE